MLALSACGSNNSSSTSASGLSAVPVTCGGKKKLQASGSTAQENAIEQFVYAYIRACPSYTLDYNANGSGAGVQQFVNNETDLAGTDKPLDPAKGEPDRAQQRCGSPAWDLPAVFGPIAVTYNVAGVTSLNLDGPTTAKIFNGSIKDWNDPAIKALNADVNLPATPINVVFRDDKSGTTYNFQKYLDAASDGAWGKGTDETFDGGVGQGATRKRRDLDGSAGNRRVNHLQRMVVRGGPPVDHGPDRHVGRSEPSDDHARLGRQDDRRGEVRRAGQRSGGRHVVVLQAIAGRRLSDRARDV